MQNQQNLMKQTRENSQKPKIEPRPIKLKIVTETNFGTGNTNLTMKKSENQPLTTPLPHPTKIEK